MTSYLKEINLFVLDVGSRMEKEELAMSSKFVIQFLKQRIFDKNMRAGVVLVGARGAGRGGGGGGGGRSQEREETGGGKRVEGQARQKLRTSDTRLAGSRSFFSKEGGGAFEGYDHVRLLEDVGELSTGLLESVGNVVLEHGSSSCT
eukprot:268692-Hanusia_phi.AAC.1